MALPLLSWGAGLPRAGAQEVLFRDKEEARSYFRSIHKEKQEAEESVQRLERRLSDLQTELGYLRTDFFQIVNSIDESGESTTENSFLTSLMTLFKGYTTQQVFMLIALGHIRYHVLYLETKQEASLLTSRVVEIVQSAFPPKLQKDVQTIWGVVDEEQIEQIIDKYIDDLPKALSLQLQRVLGQVDRVIQDLDAISGRKELVEVEIEGNERFLFAE